MDISLNYKRLKQWNYLEAQKNNRQKTTTKKQKKSTQSLSS